MSDPPPPSFPRHGGDLAAAGAAYGEPDDGWLDLSTGINPDPYPAAAINPETLRRLPDPAALVRLGAVAREAYGAPASTSITATPGTDLAIRLLPLISSPSTVTIVGPTYSTHAKSWAAAGRAFRQTRDLPNTASGGIVVVTNPNNPDGRRFRPEDLATTARSLDAAGGTLVVDEAFADVAPEISMVPWLDRAPAVVLRSFGKFFGLGGLRLGFLLGPPEVIAQVEQVMGDWPVSSAAIEIGTKALADRPWQETARRTIGHRAAAVRALFEARGLSLVGDAGLFLLVEHPDAAGLHRRLAQHGVWTPIFAGQPNWLRIGLPPEAALDRLDRALASGIG